MPEPQQTPSTTGPTYVAGENMIRVGQPLPGKSTVVPMPGTQVSGATTGTTSTAGTTGMKTSSPLQQQGMQQPGFQQQGFQQQGLKTSSPMPQQQGTQMGSSSLGMQPCGTTHSTGVCGVIAPNCVLQTPQDFRRAGAEIELIGDYIALAVAESKGRAIGIAQHVEVAADLAKSKDKDKDTMVASRVDTYTELEHLAKKVARQGRKLAWLKTTSLFGHAVRYDKDDAEVAGSKRSPISLEAKTLPGLTIFTPSFIGKPIESQQQINVIAHEIEAMGNFLIIEAQRCRTQCELDKRRAVDIKDKDVTSQSKHESKISLQYEKYGKKIARRGQEMANLTFL